MANVSQQVKNFIAGVSQQPTILKFVDQLDEQINGISTTAKGLQKRPPTIHVANLGDIPYPAKPLIHFINRDDKEKYVVNFTGNTLGVWGLDGKVYPVYLQGNSMDYLQTPTPRQDLKVITVADYTFIVNKNITVSKSPYINDTSWNNQGALISIKSGQYARQYVIYVNNEEACRYETPNGSEPNHAMLASTTAISEGLVKDLKTKGKWKIESGEGWLYIYSDTIPITSLRTMDGGNNSYMFGFLKATQKFSNLPNSAPPYYTMLVKGDNMSLSDDYYVRFNPATSLWEECARPNQLNTINSDTMPHALIRQADGSFIFKNLEWNIRSVGDDDSNPFPSFVGKCLNDVCFIRNRLGFLAGENAILSASGEFFRFFLKTARDISDADPIDVSAPDEDISILKHAVSFNEELLLFSDSSQFIGRSDSLFSPKYFKVDRTTKFDCNPNCRPVSAGRRVYFANARSSYSSLMEYYIIGDTSNIKDAQDVSSHIPEYIHNDIHKIIVSTTENMLLLLSTGATDTIYVYKYAWQNETRVQSSWSKWCFYGGAEILGGSFIGTDLFLVLKRGTCTYLERVRLSSDTLDLPNEPYRLYMDRKVPYYIPSGSYDSVTNTTSFRPMYAYGKEGVTSINLMSSMYCVTYDGILSQFELTESNPLISLVGNREGQNVFIGEVTLFKAQLQEVMIKNVDKSGNLVATNTGRLQVKYFVLNYEDSGVFHVTVDVKDKDSYDYVMTSKFLGDSSNTLGSMPITSGEFQFPVQSDSRDTTITVTSLAPLPLSLIGGRWEGNHVERSGR